MKAGSAFYAPSASIVQMVDSIVLDQKRTLPCAAFLEGEFGIDGLYVGVPVKLGAKGIEEIVEVELSEEEKAGLEHSAEAVRQLVETMRTQDPTL